MSARPLVIRVIARLNVGGPAHHVLNLAEDLEGYQTVLATGAAAPDEADRFSEARDRDVEVVQVPGLGPRVRPLDDVRALVALVRLFRSRRPTIVHTHTAKAGALGRVAAVLARVPVRIHTFHGHVFHGYFGPAATRLIIAIERMLARVTTRVVALSESQAKELSETYRICPRDKIAIIPLGLRLEEFTPADGGGGGALRHELGIPGTHRIVSIVGRLAPVKNHRLFLEAAGALAARTTDVAFVVVGGGSMREALEEGARELGVSDRVHFLGWRTDLAEIYQASDVVALTSHNEGTPVALIEALAAGRPIVATDVGGVRDILQDGRFGTLVPPGDVEALASAIAATMEAAEATSGSPAARARSEYASARFSVDRLAKDVRELYDTCWPMSTRVLTPVEL